MSLLKTFLTLALLATANAANIAINTPPGSFKPGDTVKLTWSAGSNSIPDSNVQLKVLDATGILDNANTILILSTIANPLTTTSYSWVIPTSPTLPSKIFFGIGSGQSFAYTAAISISGTTPTTTTITSVTTKTAVPTVSPVTGLGNISAATHSIPTSTLTLLAAIAPVVAFFALLY